MHNEIQHKRLVTTARITGLWYLLLAISGMVGFLVLHSKIYVSQNPAETLANLTEHETMARIRLLLEFVIIISQALAAVWFYKLFREIDHVAAWALAIWGMMNAAVIMLSAIAMGAAIETATAANSLGDKVAAIHVLGQLIKHAWGVGSLFFGLWLIPMGYVVTNSQRIPVWLGRVLILGGAGYLLSAFIGYVGIDAGWVSMLVLPATVGEFWMIAYLLIYGLRPANPN